MTQSLTMNTSASFANELTPTVATLATMADLCVKILQHITAGEVRQVFPLSDELRSVRARLSDQLAKRLELLKDFKPSTNLELRQLEQLKLGVGIVGKFDQVHDQWVKVLDEPDKENLSDASVDQWHIILEKRLPRGWDRRRDLLVVYGEVPSNLKTTILERFLDRVLVYQPFDHESAEHFASNTDLSVGDDAKPNQITQNIVVVRKISDFKSQFPFNNPPELILELSGPCPPSGKHIEEAKEEIKSLVLIASVSRNTIKTFGPRWFQQGLQNLPAIANSQSLADFRDSFKGLPMIMVSPGPSLDKNIQALKQAKGRAILIAPVQSMRRLHAEGIYPDFYMVIDPLDLTSEPHAFIDLQSIKPYQALIVGGSCHPNVVSAPFARKYVFGSASSSSWLTDLFGDEQVNTAGTSVAVTGMNIGLSWRCNPIILVGQDLAFTDGLQYAGRKQAGTDAAGLFELDGYHGGKVKTSYGYKVAHYEFEMIAERVLNSGKNISIINATEGGACIKGFTQKPLHAVIEELPENDGIVRKIIQSKIDEFENFPFENRIKTGKSNIRLILNQVDRLSLSAKICRQLTLKLQRKVSNQQLLKLGKEEQRVRHNLKSLDFLSLIVQEEIKHITQSLQSQSTMAENLEVSIKFFDTIIEACTLTKKGLGSSLSQM